MAARTAQFTRGVLPEQVPVPASVWRNAPPASTNKVWRAATHVDPAGPEVALLRAGPLAGLNLGDAGRQARPALDEAMDEAGAVLLRGLPLTHAAAAEDFVAGLGYTRVSYEPFAQPRQKIGSLDAATNIAAAALLDIHNEMVYNPRPAARILLICLRPAEAGGESLVGSGEAVTASVPGWVVRRFEQRGGVKYSRVYFDGSSFPPPTGGPGAAAPHLGVSWQDRSGRADAAGAAAFFEGLGLAVEWGEGGTLTAWNVQPAVVAHPRTGQRLWFNLAHSPFPGSITYGDGSPIEDEVAAALQEARFSATRCLQLAAGDVLALDNYSYLHGRLPYEGSSRLLATVLTSD